MNSIYFPPETVVIELNVKQDLSAWAVSDVLGHRFWMISVGESSEIEAPIEQIVKILTTYL